MNEPLDYPMPTYAELESAPADGFTLQVGPEQHIPVTRSVLRTGAAMSPAYECYAVIFALPEGIELPQAVFRVGSPEGKSWLLLMTPVMPEADGRFALEAVIHRKREVA
ncbi:hypothetical protein CYD26_03045 [Pseudomonas sp. FFUP_PS_473]|uniref:DUF6916 family protein n=1 Tax=Pseudomonas sp. FFUP_PS_473 TaxID=2060418 RepID=UPI000C7A84A5|nr:hypothetical protein [Pseudomonas sp. FFUP_PS_473]PLP95595.1 hypothetical protein CYD26_03045 [Pseudomonas sp. FFUP_PS_473]